ncbi:MAG: helix-turn-helix transcriptional regulator [bacterium]|nr:helix-turn-helix transcriptional regulator [bacterium]
MSNVSLPESAEVNRRLGEALKGLRTREKLTQGQLAAAVGLERTSITNIESGQQAVSVPLLVKLCRVLNASPTDLVQIEDDMPTLNETQGRYGTIARQIVKHSTRG